VGALLKEAQPCCRRKVRCGAKKKGSDKKMARGGKKPSAGEIPKKWDERRTNNPKREKKKKREIPERVENKKKKKKKKTSQEDANITRNKGAGTIMNCKEENHPTIRANIQEKPPHINIWKKNHHSRPEVIYRGGGKGHPKRGGVKILKEKSDVGGNR